MQTQGLEGTASGLEDVEEPNRVAVPRLIHSPRVRIAPAPAAASWSESALCQSVADPLIFFAPPRGAAHDDYEAGRRICNLCEVSDACLEAALRLPAACDLGLRAGTIESDRREMRTPVAGE